MAERLGELTAAPLISLFQALVAVEAWTCPQ